jgi:peptidoglycan/xylan/chitin deacetylase (PgdA/CDA1 family)
MTVLMYHAVDPGWSSSLSVSPRAFAEHCRWLEGNRTVVPLREAVERMDRRGRLPRGTVAITFDDGFDSVYDHAFPTLKRFGLPFTVFLVASTLADGLRASTWAMGSPEEPPRTLELGQLSEMREAGVHFGSHSRDHRDLTSLTEEACERDLRESREILEDALEAPIAHLAYPAGAHNPSVRRAAGRAGYTHAFATSRQLGTAGAPLAIPRIGVYPGNGALALRAKSAPWYVTVRGSRAFPLLRKAAGRGSVQLTERTRRAS